MYNNIDYGRLAIKLIEKAVKVIKEEVLDKDKKSKEKINGKAMESGDRRGDNYNNEE